MLRFVRHAALAALLFLGQVAPSFAQTYSTASPVYQPNGIKTPITTSLSAPGSIFYTAQNIGTLTVDVTGTNTGVAATFQGAVENANGTPVWKNLSVLPAGSGTAAGKITAITGDGVYKLNASGYAQVRFNLTAISTGSVNMAWSGNTPASRVDTSFERRPTYSASVTGLVTAASATDFVTLTGSATVTVRITHAECSGVAGTEGIATVNAVVRSTANTSGTSTAMVAQPHDSSDPAATAMVLAYTVNPTLGTSTAILRSGKLTLPLATSSTLVSPALSWDFGREDTEEVTLRGVTQVFALNGNATTLAATAAVNCSLTWTEE